MNHTKNTLLRAAILGALVTPPAFAQLVGPSTTTSPYVLPTVKNVWTKSILSVGDSVPATGGNGSYRMVGIPDGLGAYDNGDGTFTVLMNHELGPTDGAVRAHGKTGAFVSEWIIDKATLEVKSGADLITSQKLWDATTSSYVSDSSSYSRLCSADLPAVGAFYNASTGLGTTARIFMNGEEFGAEGRAFGSVATGPEKGISYQLPALGRFSWENSVASPYAQNKTVVIGTDDTGGGQVYLYLGNKTNTGTEVDKAGLTNGQLYGIKVPGLVTETTAMPPAGLTFELFNHGDVRNTTGTELNTLSVANEVTGFLRPEDGHWDPNNPNDFYFVTTASFTDPSRLWRLSFNDIENPELGGTVDLLLDGTEGQKMLDNMTVLENGHLLLQEDVGNNARLGRIWDYDPTTDALKEVMKHDASYFLPGPGFLTLDEESSGVIDLSHILGPGMVLFDVQAHYAISGELVQGGQLLVGAVPEANPSAAAAALFVLAGFQVRRRLQRR